MELLTTAFTQFGLPLLELSQSLPELHPLRPPAEMHHPLRWLGILGAVLLILLIGVVFWRMLRTLRQSPTAAQEAAETPRQRALALMASAQEARNQQDDRAYALALSGALRIWLEAAYALPATKETSREFLARLLPDIRFPDEQKQELRDFLALADLAKFARHGLSEEERDRMFSLTEQLIIEEPSNAATSSPTSPAN